MNFVLGAYYQDTNLWFDQDVIFAFLPVTVGGQIVPVRVQLAEFAAVVDPINSM